MQNLRQVRGKKIVLAQKQTAHRGLNPKRLRESLEHRGRRVLHPAIPIVFRHGLTPFIRTGMGVRYRGEQFLRLEETLLFAVHGRTVVPKYYTNGAVIQTFNAHLMIRSMI